MVAEVVTEEFFDGIIDQADSGFAGKSFYTRSAFIDALDSYSWFGTEGSEEDSLCEIAAFFAYVTHETYYLVEKAKDSNIVGLLVGTLGVAGYLHMIRQMKELITAAGKKAYTLVMGRPKGDTLKTSI